MEVVPNRNKYPVIDCNRGGRIYGRAPPSLIKCVIDILFTLEIIIGNPVSTRIMAQFIGSRNSCKDGFIKKTTGTVRKTGNRFKI